MKEVRKLKGLQSQLKTIEADIESLRIEMSNKQKDYNTKVHSAKKLRKEIENLNTSKTPKVTEHAIVRYFERVKGFNIAEIEKEILTDKIRGMAETLGGNGKYPNSGFEVVMKDFTVTTVI